jgi:hypothetical protein
VQQVLVQLPVQVANGVPTGTGMKPKSRHRRVSEMEHLAGGVDGEVGGSPGLVQIEVHPAFSRAHS